MPAAIEAPAEIYRTSTVLAGMANLPRASVFLRDKLFSRIVTTPTDQVDISFLQGQVEIGALLLAFQRRHGSAPRTPAIATFLTTVHETGAHADCR